MIRTPSSDNSTLVRLSLRSPVDSQILAGEKNFCKESTFLLGLLAFAIISIRDIFQLLSANAVHSIQADASIKALSSCGDLVARHNRKQHDWFETSHYCQSSSRRQVRTQYFQHFQQRSHKDTRASRVAAI